MSHRIAGIDVHKRVLAVVVSDVEVESEFQFERRTSCRSCRHRILNPAKHRRSDFRP
jgi:DNA-directed RNA polymerase subunit RPC12/RpoP